MPLVPVPDSSSRTEKDRGLRLIPRVGIAYLKFNVPFERITLNSLCNNSLEESVDE